MALLRLDGGLSKIDPTWDSCEPNHTIFSWVAEPFNVISSLGIVLAGCNAMHQARLYKFEARFLLLGFAVVLIGASSLSFHTTLSVRARHAEDMSLVFAAISWALVLGRMNNTTDRSSCFIYIAFLLAAAWVYQFESGSWCGLQTQLVVASTVGVYLLSCCVREHCNLPLLGCRGDGSWCRLEGYYTLDGSHPSMVKLQIMARLHIVCMVLALAAAVTESAFCGSVQAFQPHALWHLLLGLGCHHGLQFAMALRQSILHKAPPATAWSLGGLLGQVVPTEVPSRAMGAQLRWLLKMAGVDNIA